MDLNELDALVESIRWSEEKWPSRNPSGRIYVVEFSSGWVKVGQTAARNDHDRIDNLRREYRKIRGWDVTRKWMSDQRLSTATPADGGKPDLDRAEIDLKDHARFFARRLDECDPQGCNGESEVFLGCSFEHLVAAADVIVHCTVSRTDVTT